MKKKKERRWQTRRKYKNSDIHFKELQSGEAFNTPLYEANSWRRQHWKIYEEGDKTRLAGNFPAFILRTKSQNDANIWFHRLKCRKRRYYPPHFQRACCHTMTSLSVKNPRRQTWIHRKMPSALKLFKWIDLAVRRNNELEWVMRARKRLVYMVKRKPVLWTMSDTKHRLQVQRQCCHQHVFIEQLLLMHFSLTDENIKYSVQWYFCNNNT